MELVSLQKKPKRIGDYINVCIIFALRDLRLRPHLVRLLVESHRTVKNPGHGPAGEKKKEKENEKSLFTEGRVP